MFFMIQKFSLKCLPNVAPFLLEINKGDESSQFNVKIIKRYSYKTIE